MHNFFDDESIPVPSAWLADIQDAQIKAKVVDQDIHLVFYTDGGCRPTPRGVGGWGIHGYFYSTDKPKQGHGCQGFAPTARGYENFNGEKSKEEVKANEVTVLNYVDGTGSLVPESTNNEAELGAVVWALKTIQAMKPKSAHMVLDSRYVLDGCTEWLAGWSRNNWVKANGERISNVEWWRQVHQLLTEVMENTMMSWSWTRGHSDNIGNNKADYNATAGVFAGHNRIRLSRIIQRPIKDYWSPEANYNRFLTESCWYFTTNTEVIDHDGYRFYHQGNHGPEKEDDVFGKPAAETVYSVVALKKNEPVLEKVRSYQNQVANGASGIVVIARLTSILRPGVYNEIEQHGTSYLHKPTLKTDLYNPNGVMLTREMLPTKLAYRGIDSLIELEEKLTLFIDKAIPSDYCLTEITDNIYETVETKKEPTYKTKLAAGADSSALTVAANYADRLSGGEVKNTNVVLTLGIATPKRNFFSSVAASKPRVYVLTWPEIGSVAAFRYATIVATDEECGIWAGAYSNLRIVT